MATKYHTRIGTKKTPRRCKTTTQTLSPQQVAQNTPLFDWQLEGERIWKDNITISDLERIGEEMPFSGISIRDALDTSITLDLTTSRMKWSVAQNLLRQLPSESQTHIRLNKLPLMKDRQQLHRALKPGGYITIGTSTINRDDIQIKRKSRKVNSEC